MPRVENGPEIEGLSERIGQLRVAIRDHETWLAQAEKLLPKIYAEQKNLEAAKKAAQTNHGHVTRCNPIDLKGWECSKNLLTAAIDILIEYKQKVAHAEQTLADRKKILADNQAELDAVATALAEYGEVVVLSEFRGGRKERA